MQIHKDLREFVELLSSNEVEYVVVGAFAVAYHGYPGQTRDLDLLLRPSADNAVRVLRALLQFGFGQLDIGTEDLQAEGKVVQLGVPPNRIDLITSVSGVSFDEAWACNKESTGRAKDLGDAEELRKRGPT